MTIFLLSSSKLAFAPWQSGVGSCTYLLGTEDRGFESRHGLRFRTPSITIESFEILISIFITYICASEKNKMIFSLHHRSRS
jgi:hypothetical protein